MPVLVGDSLALLRLMGFRKRPYLRPALQVHMISTSPWATTDPTNRF